MKDITRGFYYTRDGHLVEVRHIRSRYDGLMTEIEGVIVQGGLLPAGRFMNWNAEGRFVGSMAGEAHDLDIARKA